MTSERLIVVLGATGNQGGAVARRLVAEGGWRVRGITRDPDRPESLALAELGVEVFKAEMDDRSSLDCAFQGAYGVFSVQNFWTAGYEAEVRQGRNVANAAKAAGVSHFIYTSVGGAERKTGLGHFESKWEIEKHIASLILPATVFRPVFFMDNFKGPNFRPAILEGKLAMALRPETKLQMIALEDIGALVALTFRQPDQFIGRSIEIAGDELTMPETAETFSRMIGRAVGYVQLDIEEVRRQSREWAQMLIWFDQHGYCADISYLRQLHPQLLTLDQWIRRTGWVESGKEQLIGAR